MARGRLGDRDGPLRVLYFGTYDRGVGRNVVTQEALRAVGAEVEDCHAPLWRDTTEKLAALRGPAPVGWAGRQARAWVRLLRGYAAAGDFDVLLVGATAHLDLPLARALATAAGRPLVFDPLVSALETVRDRGLVTSRLRLRGLAALERALLRLPDVVLVDTAAHADAMAAEVGLCRERVHVMPAGAPAVYSHRARPYAARRGTPERPLRVVYFGQFIPLHGVDVIVRAARALASRTDIRFELVGAGQELARCRALARRLGTDNVAFRPTWLPPEALADLVLARADVCLGAFGSEPKARRVVPFKVFTALAYGRPVVTADTPAARELFPSHVELATVPPDDPAALAAAIAHLADRPALRADLAAFGKRAYDTRFSAPALGRDLAARLEETARRHSARPYVGPRHAWRTELLAEELAGAAPPGDLLDAGCGDADLAADLAATGRRVVAVDIDLARLRDARARPDRRAVEFVCARLGALPLPDRTMSGAAAGEVLEHIADDRAAALEMARTLAPGGVLAATVPAGARRFGPPDMAAGHRRRYGAADLERLMAAAGLHTRALRTYGFPFGRLYDRIVQRPAMSARRSRLSGLVAWLGRNRFLDRLWRALFGLDDRLPTAGEGSGWMVVARRPDDPPSEER